jgi:hypothetical protein
MVVDAGHTKPTNQIVVDGQNKHVQFMKVETNTNMYAGRLVKKGTASDDAIVNTAEGVAVGWLGYEDTHKKYRPATVDTIYAADVQAAILNGNGIIVVGSIGFSQTLIKGDMLVGDADGQLVKWSVGHTPVAIAEEAVTTATNTTSDIMVRSLI